MKIARTGNVQRSGVEMIPLGERLAVMVLMRGGVRGHNGPDLSVRPEHRRTRLD